MSVRRGHRYDSARMPVITSALRNFPHLRWYDKPGIPLHPSRPFDRFPFSCCTLFTTLPRSLTGYSTAARGLMRADLARLRASAA